MSDNDWEKIEVGLSETWNPEENKSIEGKYVELKSNVGANGSQMYVLETVDGNVSVWDTTVLNTKMKTVNLGDTVKLVYLGVKESPKSGRSYKDFDIFVKRAK